MKTPEYPIPFALYRRGYSAMTMNIIKPKVKEGEKKAKAGGIFVQMANANKGEDTFDWDNACTLTLDATELGEIITAMKSGFKNRVHILHDPNMKSKNAGKIMNILDLSKDSKSGKIYLNMQYKNKPKNKQNKVGMSLSPAELQVMFKLFEYAIPKVLAW